MMKKILAISLLAALPFTMTQANELDADTKARIGTSKAAIKSFFGSLKGELQKGMKAGGPVNALGVCQATAPAISAEQSKKSAMQVARTSLKLRNPANAPDAWEASVLADFETRKAAGEDVKKMAKFAVVESDGKKQFRFMKAIPTGEVCLKCHGSNLPAPVKAKLNELYPADKATGYKLGDIRGAFTITQDM